MEVMTIYLSTVDDVERFVNIVNKVPFEVDLSAGRFTVNAKSIMAVSSLDLNQPLKVIMFCDECCSLIKELGIFERKQT